MKVDSNRPVARALPEQEQGAFDSGRGAEPPTAKCDSHGHYCRRENPRTLSLSLSQTLRPAVRSAALATRIGALQRNLNAALVRVVPRLPDAAANAAPRPRSAFLPLPAYGTVSSPVVGGRRARVVCAVNGTLIRFRPPVPVPQIQQPTAKNKTPNLNSNLTRNHDENSI